MATKKITDLVEITTAADDDVLPIVDVSLDVTNKITASNLIKSKQDLLESGTNIKTINSTSLLGSGNIDVAADWGDIGGTLSNQTDLQNALDAKQETLVSGTNIKTINSTSLLGSGNISIEANPSGGAGLIQFSDGSAFGSDSNLFWDNTNKRLGIGEDTPTARMHIKGSGSTSATTSLLVQNGGSNDTVEVLDDGGINFNSNAFRYNLLNGRNIFEIVSGGGGVIDFNPGASNSVTFRIRSDNDTFLFETQPATDQIGMGTGAPDASAKLQIASTTKGFLPPKMTTTQKNAISSPAAGLQVYDTTLNQMSYYNGTSWINF